MFAESSGKIELRLNKKGEWLSIESTGSSALNSDSEHDIEQAMIKATLRAKANLAEFIKNDIKSYKTTYNSSSYTQEANESNKIISEVSEEIKSNSEMILIGIYTTERKISDDRKYVFVKVKSDKKTRDTIKSSSLLR